jgi:hypothetical protein
MTYTIVSAVALLATFSIWSKDNALNLGIKLAYLSVGVWGIVTYVRG